MATFQCESGTVSSTILNYISGLLENPFEEYFVCRVQSNDYGADYILVYEPALGAGSVTGNGYLLFDGSSGTWQEYNGSVTVSQISGKYCYSSEGSFPKLPESGFPISSAIVFMLAFFAVLHFLEQFMLALMHKLHSGGYIHEKNT